MRFAIFRISTVVLMAAAMIGLTIDGAPPAQAATVNVTIGVLKYSVNPAHPDRGATVKGATRYGIRVDIPAQVQIRGQHYRVTRIGKGAFRLGGITSVTLPRTIVSIGSLAFASNKLTRVTLPPRLESLGDYAFGSNRLTSITIPASVKHWGGNEFYDNRLASVRFKKGLTKIGARSFAFNSLRTITIPGTVTRIGPSAFMANKITAVTLPRSITSIEAATFSGNRLKTVTIPDTVRTIDSHAFSENKLRRVVIGAKVQTLGEGSFGDNPTLTSVVMRGPAPNSVFEAGTTVTRHYWFGGSGQTTETTAVDLVESFDSSNAKLRIRYPAEFANDDELGYSPQSWLGYRSQPY